MHWGKQRHNRKHMSKKYNMIKNHFQADSAPRRDARKRKQALIDNAKANELSARRNQTHQSEEQEGNGNGNSGEND